MLRGTESGDVLEPFFFNAKNSQFDSFFCSFYNLDWQIFFSLKIFHLKKLLMMSNFAKYTFRKSTIFKISPKRPQLRSNKRGEKRKPT